LPPAAKALHPWNPTGNVPVRIGGFAAFTFPEKSEPFQIAGE